MDAMSDIEMLRTQNERYKQALRDIVNVLGPEICTCEQGCGLHDEAHDALATAIEALTES